MYEVDPTTMELKSSPFAKSKCIMSFGERWIQKSMSGPTTK